MKLFPVMMVGLLAACNKGGGKVDLSKDTDKVGYAIGMSIGKNLKKEGAEVSTSALAMGLEDGFTDKPAQLTDEQIREAMTAFQQKMMAKQQEKMMGAQAPKDDAAGQKNEEAGTAFLAENAKKSGVKTTDSGLQYIEVSAGKGKSPKATDTVSVNYKGTLIDGTVFDSSYDRGQPASFPVNQVIPGWTEALQLMKEGSKYKLFIPSKLAYGPRGAGEKIGPNSTLIFEVELLKVQ